MTRPIRTEELRTAEITTAGPEATSTHDFSAIARQVVYARTRYNAQLEVEYAPRDGWTTDIHQAYIVSEHNKKEIPFFLPLAAERGGQISEIDISVYDKDAAPEANDAVRPLSPKVPVIGEWQDYIALARPISAAGRPVVEAHPLFLGHHGVYEGRAVLTSTPHLAVVGTAATVDRNMIDGLDGQHRAVGWSNWNRHPRIGFRPVVRVISIAPHDLFTEPK